MSLANLDVARVEETNVIMASSPWFSGDVIVGCFKEREKECISLGLCTLSAFVSVVACLILTYQRCYLRKQLSPEVATCAVYCFLGNLCHSVGAFLSKQLSFQVHMGAFWAVLDLITFFAVLVPICLFSHSEKGKRLRVMKRRRRQNLFSVSLLLMVVGGGMYLTVMNPIQPLNSSPNSRRLLGAFVHDSLELLGYILGLLSFVISWTSRFPTILTVYNRKRRGTVYVMTGILHAMAGGLYTAAILVHDTRLAFVVKALPWIMSSTCWGVLEFVILAISLSRWRSVYHQTVRPLSSDTVALLGAASGRDGHVGPEERKGKKEDAPHFSAMTNMNIPKKTDMGQYMDVNVQPVRKVCLKEVRVSHEGQPGSQPLKRTVRVVRVDEACSSDSSSFNSDLEWDFEEASSSQWRKHSKKQDNLDAFPLQPWTVKPILTASEQPGSHFCYCNKTMADGRTDYEKTTSCSKK